MASRVADETVATPCLACSGVLTARFSCVCLSGDLIEPFR